MKNKLIITITDINGSHSYSFNKIIKKVILIVIALIVVGMASSVFWINHLSTKLDKLKKTKELQIQKLIKIKQQLSTQNHILSMQIKDKVKDIEELGQKLEEIEEILGINDKTTNDPIKRVDIAKITSSQKAYMLQTIPNGSPLKKTFSYKKEPHYNLSKSY
jgi:long-subunit acyl-CoA synthetase (AMP-forming)